MTNIMTPTDWVIATLLADPTLDAQIGERVYLDIIPAEVTPVYPYIVVSKSPGTPLTNSSADIIWFDDLVDVDVYDQADSSATAAAILNRAIDVLHKGNGSTADGGTVIGCVFQGEIPVNAEAEARVIYQRRSGEFRVYSQ